LHISARRRVLLEALLEVVILIFQKLIEELCITFYASVSIVTNAGSLCVYLFLVYYLATTSPVCFSSVALVQPLIRASFVFTVH